MEGIEMAVPPSEQLFSDDFCSVVLSQFSDSNNEHHAHVCTAIGAMAQELKDQNLPLSPIAYFGATCSSLDRLSSSTDHPGHLLDALIAILSLVIDRFSLAVIKAKFCYLSELLNRLLCMKSVGIDGIVPGLKCVSRLLTARDDAEWEDVKQLYGVLVNYITDDRTKVRKRSHSCLRQVVEYFQSVPTLAPLHSQASDEIVKVFERYLLLAGGSNANVSDGSKAAQEVLYILDALKMCLPNISSKSATNILKYYKSLLELKHPIVTRRITDGLNALCLHSSGGISAELLLDLLCSLAFSVSVNESSADSMTFTTRLLDTGMKRVYSVNRQICVVKLPVIFNALKDVLASEHEGAVVAAVATFKSLINECIDESLIRQGVDQINTTERKSGPTIIEKVCATVESLLDYHFEAIWAMSFQIVSTMFNRLGKYSSYFLEGTLKSLADMQKQPDEDFSLRKQLHECVGTALAALGPKDFLNLLPLNLEVEDLSESNLWLFPILKQYTVGARLSYFTESILPMIYKLKQKSGMLEQEGKLQYARAVDGIVYSMWSLLPSFCNYPVDTSQSFKDMAVALCKALREETDVRGIVCSSIQILIQQNKKIVEGKESSPNPELRVPEEQAIAFYTTSVAESNLITLRSSALVLFEALDEIYMGSSFSKDVAGILQSTIGDLASISDKKDVTDFFMRTMRRLLKVTQAVGISNRSDNSNSMEIDSSNRVLLSAARAQYFDLAVSFLPGLDSKEVDLLFTAIQPALKDADGLIQKKAYRVLSLIFQGSSDFVSRRLEEMLNLMTEFDALSLCHFSAKRHRLDCLYYLIIHILKKGSEQRRQAITASFLTEIILALKEANKKTRNQAYNILVQIGHACEDGKGDKEKLHHFFNLVAAGLAGETPHMISAAMTGLARLTYEFSDLVSIAYSVLPSAFLLLQGKNKEIVKAILGLLKVLVAKSPAEGLQTHLRSMVKGLLNWQDSMRNHFKSKVKLLLEMLVKKCGLDAVKEVMPEEHMKLLTNIRKLKEQKEKKQTAKSSDDKSIQSKATTSRMSRWGHTRIFSDFDDAETMDSDDETADAQSISTRRGKYSSAVQSKTALPRSKRARKAAKSLQEDSFDQLDDEPLDLLDQQQTRSALRSSQLGKKKVESDDELEIDSEGRLVIREDSKSKKADQKKKRELPSETNEDGDARSEAGSHLSGSSKKSKKRMKTSEAGWSYTGKEYASKKAGGDLKRKDKLEPYAYWPLDRKMMSRRPEQRAAARRGMVSVVKLTKKMEGKSVSNALFMTSKKRKKGGGN